MPKKKGGSKKGGKKAKKVVEDTKVVRDMINASAKGDAESLQKFLEMPVTERKFDLTQSCGDCLPAAAENGHTETTRLLLDANCDVNYKSGDALHQAALGGHMDCMHLLLEREADVNEKAVFNEFTALHFAALKGRVEVADFLLRSGAKVDERTHEENCAVTNGWSPLHIAADGGHLDLVEFLVESGKATVDLPTVNGETALAIAAEHGRFGVVKYLVSAGADLHAVRRGLNVVQWCIYRCNPDTVQFLVSYGAKPDMGIKCLWFPSLDDTLLSIIKNEFSEAVFEKVDIAIYRGSVKLRERAAHMRLLSDVKWEDEANYDPDSFSGAAEPEMKLFPKHIVHMISSYEL